MALLLIPNLKFMKAPNIKYTMEISAIRIMPLYHILDFTTSPIFLILGLLNANVRNDIATIKAIAIHKVITCPVISIKLGLSYF